jgi:hypothetical protein
MPQTPAANLDALQNAAVDALRRYPTAVGSDATDALRAVATMFVTAREHFYTRTGETDWLGQTHAYRAWVRETLDAAQFSPDMAATVPSAIRYHVGSALRERLDPSTLDALGLRTPSPRERSVEKRQGQSALLSLFRGGARFTMAEQMLSVTSATLVALRRFDLTVLSAGDYARVAAALAEVRDAADALAKGYEHF